MLCNLDHIVVPYTEGIQGVHTYVCAVEGSPCAYCVTWWCEAYYVCTVCVYSLHVLQVVLCFSPVGDTLRVRCRNFPAVVNCTSIDWFHEWPEEALMSVSHRFLEDVELLTVRGVWCCFAHLSDLTIYLCTCCIFECQLCCCLLCIYVCMYV